MKRIFTILLFTVWTCVAFSQTTKDSLAELQSLLDSIPDISLAELGIDTTAEIVPDTLHLVIPASIASDTAYASTCLNQAIELINADKYDEAYVKADTAKHIYQMNVGYVSKGVADCLHQMGRSLILNSNFQKSIDVNFKSLTIRLKLALDLNLDVASSCNIIGLSYEEIGKYDKAIIYHIKALRIRNNILSTNDILIANSTYNLGNCYSQLGEIYTAIDFIKKSLDIRETLLGPNSLDLGISYYSLGNSFSSIGNYKKALDYHQKALDIFIFNLGLYHKYVGYVYNALGNDFTEIGDFIKAKEYHEKALFLRIKLFGKWHIDSAGSFHNLGRLNHQMGNKMMHFNYAKESLLIRQRILEPNNIEMAESYNSLGVYYEGIQDFDSALNYYQKSLEIYNKTVETSHALVGQIKNNIGVIYKNIKNYSKAEKYYSDALNYNMNTPIDDIARYNANLGEIFCLQKNYDSAIKIYNKAKYLLKKSNGEDHPDLIVILRMMSSIYLQNENYDSSLNYLHQAISGIKAQMASNISSETKNLYQSQNIPVIESAIDVSLIKSKQDQHDSLKLITYEYTELAKASLLQSQIKQTDALTFADIPDSLLQKEYDLRIDINWREKQKQGLLEKGKEETDPEVLRISSIIFDLKREQETLFETLEKDYPEYYRLKYDTKTISLEDTQQKLLQKGQTLLEYFVGDSSIFIFVVRPDTFDVVKVKKDFSLDSLVRQMQTGLYGYHGQTPDKRTDVSYKKSILDYTKAAHELYNRIVAPVAHLLTSNLVIIPDGVLGYVPFEALLKSNPEKLNQFATYPYLINDHTISYNYSATLWNEMKSKKHKKEPSKSLVAFAPFYEGSYTLIDSTINLVFDTLSDGRDTTIFQDVVSRKTYAPLPSSGIEAGTVSKLYKGDYFVNGDATEQKFYDIAGDYRFIHLSTHGVADARQGDYSYLAFAEQKDSIENEFLYVRDIYNTSLNADLVFLSACETAQGELQRGEGIISLARAFAYAGAKSIITTLWQVDDAATKDISIDFYKNLKKGFTKDVALRQAKLRHIKSARSAQKHPFFWAAMIGIGDMEIVKK